MNIDIKKDYYDILGLTMAATDAEIVASFPVRTAAVASGTLTGVTVEDINEAYIVLTTKRSDYDRARRDYLAELQRKADAEAEQERQRQEAEARKREQEESERRRKEEAERAKQAKKDQKEAEKARKKAERDAKISAKKVKTIEEDKGTADKGRNIIRNAATVVIAALIIAGIGVGAFFGVKAINEHFNKKQAASTSASYSQSVDVDGSRSSIGTDAGSSQTGTTQDGSTTTTQLDGDQTPAVTAINLGDVNDINVVSEKATDLAKELKSAGVVNPVTGVEYSAQELVKLIQYANGVYTPGSELEANSLHGETLNLLISPINNMGYLYHAAYASGNDDFGPLLNTVSVNHVRFDNAIAGYGQNGVYPLIQWITDKRIAIYSTTDRNEISSIYCEVGQVMADIMKGNGCTIVVKENGQDVEYRVTSEQLLANPSSALLLTTEAQLVFANHYEKRDDNDKVIASGPTSWEVKNLLNTNGVDENGMPIYGVDVVTLDEIQAWINNGCNYEWAISDVLIDGQTFGERIQGISTGTALNNLAISQGKTK